MADPILTRVRRRSKRFVLAESSYWSAVFRRQFSSPTVTFWPEMPHPYTTAYQICRMLGLRVSRRRRASTKLVMAWQDTTFREPFAPPFPVDGVEVVNLNCRDISKRRLDEAHQSVFGYRLAVDPLAFEGPAVCKSDANSRHDYRTITCPIAQAEPEMVYQRVVDNTEPTGLVRDIRVAVMKDTIPLAYYKWRPSHDRFSNSNSKAEIVDVSAVLSLAEQNLVLQLCREMGMEFGELDILRDNGTGHVFVVDANSTPLGPPNHIEPSQFGRALRTLSAAFESTFLPPGMPLLMAEGGKIS